MAPPPVPDSQPGVDAPELAKLGPYPVGVRTLPVTVADADGRPRRILVDVWYPAARRGKPVQYAAAFPGEAQGAWAKARFAGLATRDAAADRSGAHPLVVVSHGYSGAPAALSWLTENLASKGYVAAAPRHEDPPITDRAQFPTVAARRPLDIAGVTRQLQADARRRAGPLQGLIDPDHVAFIGYSMGGYGALTVAGAGLSPGFAAMAGRGVSAFVAGAPRPPQTQISGLRAVVAIAPAGATFGAWTPAGLAELRQPVLLIVGDQDHTVGYDPGVRTIYDGAVNAPRDLLVFEGAGHSIGMDAAPSGMRGRLWDQDWFEDPVWRKARIIAVNLHVITAFLALHLRDDAAAGAYLALSPRSSDALWPTGAAYGDFSPGPPAASVWKGFQRGHAAGLAFSHREPAPASSRQP